MNNLSYLKEQIKGYDIDVDTEEAHENSEEELDADNEDVLITMSNNGTMSFESSAIANSSGNEFESSGDGEDEDELENKSSYMPIPNNSDGMVSSQLQRLSQLVRKVNNKQNADLTPNDLNQYLSLHKLIHQKVPSNAIAEPVPHNELIKDHHLKQILDLQKKLNNLANTRDTYSTPPTPVKFTVNGNGVYPAEATTVHIKAANALKNPRFPDAGYSSSQIVVNRPGGSVVFRLPNSGYPQKDATNSKKPENQISEDTLKTLLELTKHMSNQAPNTPSFIHSLPSTPSTYQQPIIQPVLYQFPWDQFSLASLFEIINSKKGEKIQNDDGSMEKIATVSGSVPTTPNAAIEPDDSGTTTIVHNHIPITIAHPNPTNSIVNRFHAASTTTPRPLIDRYDSYGYKKPVEHTDSNDYYPYPPYSQNLHKDPARQHYPSIGGTMVSYTSPFSTQPTAYDANVEQPQYIQIAQSRPDHYIPVYPSSNAIQNDGVRPIPTFASVNGGYTQKFYSTYTPQPHLSENNVNDVVHITQKPFPTLRPMVNYVPIATASSPTPSYADPPESFTQVHKHPNIADKIDHFTDVNDGDDQYENIDDYQNTNVEQTSNENVMDLLANYNSRLKSNSESTTDMGESLSMPNSNAEKKPAYKYKTIQSSSKHKQFVNINGNFMELETYQQSIEPYLQKDTILDSQIQVLTCATGVRQANSTDCTRYFVCNEKTGKILSYACPPHTAFNGDTRICNAETYSRCFSDRLTQGNTKVVQKMSIQEANRIKAEAVKAQQLAHLIKIETDKILNQAHQVKYKQQMFNGGKSTVQAVAPTRPTQFIQQRPYRKSQTIQTAAATPTKQTVKNTTQRVKKPKGKRKIPCRSEGKLVDNLSQNHYFLCFKDQTKTMRARRLQCPSKLIFCPSTLVCTATERCMNKFNRM